MSFSEIYNLSHFLNFQFLHIICWTEFRNENIYDIIGFKLQERMFSKWRSTLIIKFRRRHLRTMPQSVHFTTGKIQLNQSISTIFKSQIHNITNVIAKKKKKQFAYKRKFYIKEIFFYINVSLFLKYYKLNLFQSNERSNQQLYFHQTLNCCFMYSPLFFYCNINPISVGRGDGEGSDSTITFMSPILD